MNPSRKTNGTGYVGLAHRAQKESAAASTGPGKAYKTIDLARAAARQSASKEVGSTVVDGGEWTYELAGVERLRVLRFNTTEGDKVFRPIHRTKRGWKLGDPTGPFPLYQHDALGKQETVWICEGEKAADAARSLGFTATTSAHGSSAPARSDWTVLAGRDVVILPDTDEPGEKYARDVVTILVTLDPPARVRVVKLPGLTEGGDIVEYIASFGDAAEPDSIRRNIELLATSTRALDSSEIVGGPVLTCMANVEPQTVQWLWPGRIAIGRATLLVGRPGGGKSYLTCDMTARVTTGSDWPDGSPCQCGSVILVCAEDDPGDTIRPRLDACGADVTRVHLLSAVRRVRDDGTKQEVMFTLADVEQLRKALLKVPDCRLIVVDPIGSFLGGGVDSHRDSEVRAVLAPIAMLAEKHGVALVIVAHTRKASAAAADDTALGSRAFTGLARAVWHLMHDPDNPERRLLLPGKNNLSKQGSGLAFCIAGDPVGTVLWEDQCVELSADDGLAAITDRRPAKAEPDSDRSKPGPRPTARTAAEKWLKELLSTRSMQVGSPKKPGPGTIAEAAKEAGFSWGTIRRAREQLGIIPIKGQFTDGWYWELPDDSGEGDGSAQEPPADSTSTTCAPSSEPAQVRLNPAKTGAFGLPDTMSELPICAPPVRTLLSNELPKPPNEGAQDAHNA